MGRKNYKASAQDRKVTTEGAGYAGSFQQLLSEFKKTNSWLESQLQGNGSSKATPAGINVAVLHQEFISRLRKEGCSTDRYPFQTRRHGYEALVAYVRKKIQDGNPALANLKYGETANQATGRNSISVALTRPLHCLAKVAYDEYQLPAIGTMVIVVDGTDVEVPLSRAYFCPIVDYKSEAVLGYSWSISERFKSANLLEAFECAINPPQQKIHPAFESIKSLEGEGLPASVVPEAKGRRIAILCLDNHLTHISNSVVVGLRRKTGVIITYGKVHSWIERNVVERLFSELQQNLRRIASTTGSGPTDPNVRDPVGKSIRDRIRMADLIAVMEKLVSRHNARRRRALFNATPNELIAADWAKNSRLQIVPLYKESFMSNPSLAAESEWVTVRGDRSTHRTPYIQLDNVAYTNDILRQSWALIGTKLNVQIRGDYRTVRAFREDGTEFGVLSVSGGWAVRPHTRETRKEINRLYSAGLFAYRADDPILHYQEYLASKALKSVKGKKSPKIVQESNALARTLAHSSNDEESDTLKYEAKSGVLVKDTSVKPKGRRDFFSSGNS
ncbi:hypothetical protein [Acidovorax sp. A1169]|uniref:hypothetical protein n=1 Tax=Acidovorax sp. A1169 TaxID=3059524 RepID=UPI002737DA05|nr:hypothetical protein [Acidovorax sp. A1169]MDP4077044.1 hypothetical protein [Acidovorax sp. A1169]